MLPPGQNLWPCIPKAHGYLSLSVAGRFAVKLSGIYILVMPMALVHHTPLRYAADRYCSHPPPSRGVRKQCQDGKHGCTTRFCNFYATDSYEGQVDTIALVMGDSFERSVLQCEQTYAVHLPVLTKPVYCLLLPEASLRHVYLWPLGAAWTDSFPYNAETAVLCSTP